MDKYPNVPETVIVATVTALLGLLGLYITPVFFLTSLILPVPLAYLILKRDLRHGLLALMMSTVMLMFAFTHIKAALLMVLQFGPPGVIVGLLLKNRVTVSKSINVLFFWALVAAAVNLIISFAVNDAGTAKVAHEFRATMDQMARVYMQNGIMDESGRQQFMAAAEQIARLVQTFIPGSVVVWSLIMTLASYFITRYIMHRLGLAQTEKFDFARWQLPWYSTWLVITGLALTLGGDELAISTMEIVGKNILYIAAFVFFALGTAVLTYFMQVWKASRVVKIIIIVVLTLYLPFTITMTLACGVVDPLVNLRRLTANGDEGIKGG
jgi:uncharacterized protein YybS (DUF2232 family)